MKIIKDGMIEAMPQHDRAKAHADNAVEYGRRAMIAIKIAAVAMAVSVTLQIIAAVK